MWCCFSAAAIYWSVRRSGVSSGTRHAAALLPHPSACSRQQHHHQHLHLQHHPGPAAGDHALAHRCAQTSGPAPRQQDPRSQAGAAVAAATSATAADAEHASTAAPAADGTLPGSAPSAGQTARSRGTGGCHGAAAPADQDRPGTLTDWHERAYRHDNRGLICGGGAAARCHSSRPVAVGNRGGGWRRGESALSVNTVLNEKILFCWWRNCVISCKLIIN